MSAATSARGIHVLVGIRQPGSVGGVSRVEDATTLAVRSSPLVLLGDRLGKHRSTRPFPSKI